MKKKILYTLSLLVTLLLLVLAGCDVRYEYETYANASAYAAGNARISFNVAVLDVDWIGGQVKLEYTDDDILSLTEEIDFNAETTDFDWTSNEDWKMRWQINGTTLQIKYAKSGARLVNNLQKTLTIKVPKRTDLWSLTVKTVSAGIDAALNTWGASFETVSGNINYTGLVTNALDIETVSGEIAIVTATAPSLITFETVSGDVKYIAEKSMPAKIEADSVSGNFTLTLPFSASFRAWLHSVSGNMQVDSAFSATNQGSSVIVGGGTNIIDAESVSGNLRIVRGNGTNE